jgi:hypothetical protein
LGLEDLARQIAIAETLNPTLGVSKQVLSVHKLVVKDNTPKILQIDGSRELGAFFVYFALEGEPYHFVIVIRSANDRMVAAAAYIEAGVRVYLTIVSMSLDPLSITNKVRLSPTRSYRMGDRIRSQHRTSPIAKEHRWYFEPQQDTPGELEQKLEFLLDRLKPSQAEIASLQNECEIEVSICYEGYRGSMGGWHIDKATIQQIAALGAEIDLDLYAYGENDLPS